MKASNFISTHSNATRLEGGSVSWESPSNIALVKYWGKKEPQVPMNSSISFTLSYCHTRTTMNYRVRQDSAASKWFRVYLEGQLAPDFEPKIRTFFERVEPYIAFIRDLEFDIHTSNSFPHSSGIASSASGMSALALCLMSLERKLSPDMSEDFFTKKSSFLARLGSGSAARSIEGPLVVWGKHRDIDGSSDLVGIKYPFEVHHVFQNYQDTILLVDKGVKQVSSTIGHGLMLRHPYASARFKQANAHMSELIAILRTGDLSGFIRIVESEALSLHAMMMTSDPYFVLMRPNTLHIIEKIWAFRKSSGTPLCFTLDAGANVHVLYPEKDKQAVWAFIENELLSHCQNKQHIRDETGMGASLITSP